MKPISVWIIDDDTTSSYLSTRLLTKDFGLQNILSFADVDLAYKALKDHFLTNSLPSVIFLDINMPILDGFGLLQKLAEENLSLGDTKIYMLTSSGHPKDRAKAFTSDIPIAGYITKPLTKEKVEKLLSMP